MFLYMYNMFSNAPSNILVVIYEKDQWTLRVRVLITVCAGWSSTSNVVIYNALCRIIK